MRDLRLALAAVRDVGVRSALEKDIHLSEAAVLHVVPVASQDDRQRAYLRDLSSSYARAGQVQWFNPVHDQEWEEWVRGGCTDQSVFRCDAPDLDG